MTRGGRHGRTSDLLDRLEVVDGLLRIDRVDDFLELARRPGGIVRRSNSECIGPKRLRLRRVDGPDGLGVEALLMHIADNPDEGDPVVVVTDGDPLADRILILPILRRERAVDDADTARLRVVELGKSSPLDEWDPHRAKKIGRGHACRHLRGELAFFDRDVLDAEPRRVGALVPRAVARFLLRRTSPPGISRRRGSSASKNRRASSGVR